MRIASCAGRDSREAERARVGAADEHPAVQNGLILKTDLHRRVDQGYVTVTPEYRLEVSRRWKDEFQNGRVCYEMQGRRLAVPQRPELRPSRAASAWHAERRCS